MKCALIMLFIAGLMACKAKVPTEVTNTLPEGWVEDPFIECAPEEQVKAIFSSTNWVLDKIEGDLEQEEIERLQDVLYKDEYLTPIYVEDCFTLETFPKNVDKEPLTEVSSEQVLYWIERPKYFIYYLISNKRLVNYGSGNSYLYYTGTPRD